ncbi:GntR family transcriptional regulator [Clostridium sp. DL1XJH146]
MNITIDYSSNLPMYEQIKVILKENILSGKLKYNDPLPSVRNLAKELNVSNITTKRAYSELEKENLIYSVSGRGTFVNNPDIKRLKEEKRITSIENYKRETLELKKLGIKKEEIINIIKKVYEEEK